MGMFEMMSVAGGGMLVMLAPAFVMPFLYIYLIHDYSGRRQGKRDPRLGSKVFTTLMMTLCAQLALAGVGAIGLALVVEFGGKMLGKTGAGLIMAAVLVGAFPTWLYFSRVKTNAGANVAHQALGLNALLTGMVFMAAVVVLCQAMFHDGDLAEPAVVAVIYGAAMAVTGTRLLREPIPEATIRSE